MNNRWVPLRPVRELGHEFGVLAPPSRDRGDGQLSFIAMARSPCSAFTSDAERKKLPVGLVLPCIHWCDNRVKGRQAPPPVYW